MIARTMKTVYSMGREYPGSPTPKREPDEIPTLDVMRH